MTASVRSFLDNAGSGSSVSALLPLTYSPGDLLLLLVRTTATGNTTTPTGWDVLIADHHPSTSSGDRVMAFMRTADGTEGTSVTLTNSGTPSWSIISLAIQDADDIAVNPPEASAEASGTGTAPDSPSLAPSGGAKDYLWLTWGSQEGKAGLPPTTIPAGYTYITGDSTGGAGSAATNARTFVAYKEANAASEDPGAWGLDTSEDWAAYTIAIYPAAAAGQDLSGTGSTSGTTGVTASGQKAASGTGSTSATTATSATGNQPGGISSADIGLNDTSGSTDRPWRTIFLHDGKWWGLLEDGLGTTNKGIYRRDGAGDWNEAAGGYSFGGSSQKVDGVDDGTYLFVSRLSTTAAFLRRFSYTSATQAWAEDYSTAATFFNPDKHASTVIDSVGRAWVFWVDNSTGDLMYEVMDTLDGSSIQSATALVTGLSTSTPEQAIACSFNDGDASVGVAFSDHLSSTTRFLHHHDADAIGTWQTEETIDGEETDDHVDIAVDGDQNVWVHYKTGAGGTANELRFNRRNASTGLWESDPGFAATEARAEGHTRPRIVVDEHGRAYLFSIHQAASSLNGDVVVRVVEPDLTLGAEQTVISGDYNDLSGTYSVATESSGIVVVAANQTTGELWEGFVPVAAAAGGSDLTGTGATSAMTGTTATGSKGAANTGSISASDGMLGVGGKGASGTGAASATTGETQSGAKAAVGTGSTLATIGATASGSAVEAHSGTGSLSATTGVTASGGRATSGTGAASATAGALATGSKAQSGAGSASATTGVAQTGAKSASGAGSASLATGITGSGTSAEAHEGVGSISLTTGTSVAGQHDGSGSGSTGAASGSSPAGFKAASAAVSASLTAGATASGSSTEAHEGSASTGAVTGVSALGSRQTGGTAQISANHDLTPVGQKNAAAGGSAALSSDTAQAGSKGAVGTGATSATTGATASGTAAQQGGGAGRIDGTISAVATGAKGAAGAGQASAVSGQTAGGAHAGTGTASASVASSTSATGSSLENESHEGTASMAVTVNVTAPGKKGTAGTTSDARTSDFVGTGAKGSLGSISDSGTTDGSSAGRKGGLGSGLIPLSVDPVTGGVKAGRGAAVGDLLVPLMASGSKSTGGSTTIALLAAMVAAGFQPSEVEAVARFSASLGATPSLAVAMDAASVLSASLGAAQSAVKSMDSTASNDGSLDVAVSVSTE